MTIQAVIFDLFGTLIANYDRNHYQRVAGNMGEAVGADPGRFTEIWRGCYVERGTGVFDTEADNVRWVCDQMGVSATPQQVEDSGNVYLEYALPYLNSPRDGAIETLTELKNRGIKTGLLSDCGPWVPRNWADSPFASLVDYPVYSSTAGIKKPDIRVYELALRGLGVEAAHAMYVADGNGTELNAADQLGMRAVRIAPWNSPGSTPDADYSTPWEGESVDDLVNLLQMLD